VPVREPKGRMLSREYMADRDWMTTYSPAEREWYMLTALFADDAGWLPWDLPDNAANLYRYEVPDDREARVASYVAHFAQAGRFIVHDCGHAHMPGVAKHPRGRAREQAVLDVHYQCTRSAPGVHPECMSLLSVPDPSVPSRASAGSALRVRPPAGAGAGGAPAGGLTPVGDVVSEFRQRVPRPGTDTRRTDG
jgi:hypothetical protein